VTDWELGSHGKVDQGNHHIQYGSIGKEVDDAKRRGIGIRVPDFRGGGRIES